MSDDALIEAMARAIDASLYGNKLNAVYCYAEAKAALAVCRSIIEERLWKRFQEMAKEAIAQERERCATEIERLRAENAKLRAVLKPFADILEKHGGFEKLPIDVAILYAAAAALKDTGDD